MKLGQQDRLGHVALRQHTGLGVARSEMCPSFALPVFLKADGCGKPYVMKMFLRITNGRKCSY